jgi:DNA-binding transcriptional regulator LsrR (DeoR family)
MMQLLIKSAWRSWKSVRLNHRRCFESRNALIELAAIHDQGAVGNICLRYYDAHGIEIRHPLGDRVVGVAFEQLKKIPRVVGIAGGKQKLPAILGALRGRWINTLITDQYTAKRLTMA